MNKLSIVFGQHGYRIHYGAYASRLGLFLHKRGTRKTFVISNDAVRQTHGRKLTDALSERGIAVRWSSGVNSEKRKNMQTVLNLYAEARNLGIDGNCVVIGLGGGVVQDVSNFFAATYKRGMPFVQIPTSLLAQVDVGFGGCAVNFGSKSVIGTFYHPVLVLVDFGLTETLSDSQVRDSLAEVINKLVCLKGSRIRNFESDVDRILMRDMTIIKRYVIAANKTKYEIIKNDETGSRGTRQVLEFGHIIGHALEEASGYRISHGSGLSAGMVVEAEVSNRLGLLPGGDFCYLKDILRKSGLPLKFPDIDPRDLLDRIHHGVKSHGGVRMVVLKKLGRPELRHVPDSVVLKALKDVWKSSYS